MHSTRACLLRSWLPNPMWCTSLISRQMVDDLVRERDILNKNLVKAASATVQQEGLLKINENTKRNLEMSISSYRASAQAQARTIKKLQEFQLIHPPPCTCADPKHSSPPFTPPLTPSPATRTAPMNANMSCCALQCTLRFWQLQRPSAAPVSHLAPLLS